MSAMTPPKEKVMTVRLESDFHQRLNARLASEGTNFQSKLEALLVEYLDGPEQDREELGRLWRAM